MGKAPHLLSKKFFFEMIHLKFSSHSCTSVKLKCIWLYFIRVFLYKGCNCQNAIVTTLAKYTATRNRKSRTYLPGGRMTRKCNCLVRPVAERTRLVRYHGRGTFITGTSNLPYFCLSSVYIQSKPSTTNSHLWASITVKKCLTTSFSRRDFTFEDKTRPAWYTHIHPYATPIIRQISDEFVVETSSWKLTYFYRQGRKCVAIISIPCIHRAARRA
jgi:hypothetical protein